MRQCAPRQYAPPSVAGTATPPLPDECVALGVHPVAQRVAGMYAAAESSVLLGEIYAWSFYWAAAVSSNFELPEDPVRTPTPTPIPSRRAWTSCGGDGSSATSRRRRTPTRSCA